VAITVRGQSAFTRDLRAQLFGHAQARTCDMPYFAMV
jgi:hypothetical protein